MGGESLKVMHLTGHTPGGCVFYNERMAFTGDLLIRGRAELDVVEGIPDEYLEMSGT